MTAGTECSTAAPTAPTRLAYTVFADRFATSLDPYESDWPSLTDILRQPKTHRAKDSCPLIKLAKFGTVQSTEGSLRHNANVLSISGVEADYDGEEMPVETAAFLLDVAGIRAAIYTSPSHTPERPRWRVLAPLSREYPPAERERFVARLNGVLGGVLASESFTLSQTYYFGKVAGATYEVQTIEGDCIDLRGDLDADAIGRDGGGVTARTEQDDCDRQMAIKTASPKTIADLDSALAALPDEWFQDYTKWISTIGMALKSLARSPVGEQALELFHKHSARCTGYDPDQAQRKWDGMNPHKITFASIFHIAQKVAGWAAPGTRAAAAAAISSGDVADYARLEDRTDTGNKNLIVRLTDGDLRYVPERRAWIGWDGSRWSEDPFATQAYAAAARVAQFYHQRAEELATKAADPALSEEEKDKISKAARSVGGWAAHCRNKRPIDNMIALTAKDGRVTVPAADLDTDKWLLGVQNGVVDLRTGKLRQAGRDELVTKHCAVHFDPAAPAPRFIQFVAEVTGDPLPVDFDADGKPVPASVGKFRPRPDLADYLQRVLGYCLTGSTAEHKMFLCVGAGSNGKNILLDVVQEIVGDYCKTIPPESLMATRQDGDAERPSPVLASLAGARMAITSESRDGQKLDVALVKRHTGGGFLTARLMRENTFRFEITHKLVLMTNHKPSLDHLDDAMRGRLHIIPFDRTWNRPGVPDRDPTLPDGDKGLQDALRGEAPGILAWLVRGALAYAKHGLEPPQAVKAMTREYFAEQDPVGRWLAGYDKCHPKDGAGAMDLFNAYQQWRRDVDTEGGKGPASVKAFAKALETNGCVKVRTKSDNRYGLRRKTGEIE